MDSAERKGLVYEVAKRTSDKGFHLERIKLQKLFYFLKEFLHLGSYRFCLYQYSPYSEELADDLEMFSSLGVIRMHGSPTGYGYQIGPGRISHEVAERASTNFGFLVNRVVNTFASYDVPTLEVMATLQFASEEIRRRTEPSRDKVVQTVSALRPRYEQAFIANCYDRLQEARRSLEIG